MPFQTKPREMSRTDFIANFGGVYESSPWVAEEAWERGLGESEDDAEGLMNLMRAVVEDASIETKRALLRAHPDLAGKAGIAGELTPDSTAEQKSSGLDQCTAEEFHRFQELNAAYKEKFGFPFILAVKGRGRHEILASFEARLPHDQDHEFREALAQVHRIAFLRLEGMEGD